MSPARQARRALLWTAGAALFAAALYGAWPVTVLQVCGTGKNGQLVLSAPLAGTSTVALGFIHSFYRVPQEERYIVRDGSLRLASVFFGSHDALDYYDPLSVYPSRKVPGGYEIDLDPPAKLPVSYAVGGQTDFWLRLEPGGKTDLSRLLLHQDGFRLRVVRRPRIITTVMEWLRGC